MARVLLIFLVFLSSALSANAQDRDDNGFIISYLEDSISTENFILRLSGVTGLLASEADVKTITIADRDGVWLTITDAHILWNRASLLRGRVDIQELKATRIEVARRPAPNRPSITPEAEPFSLPDLPVAVILEKLEIAEVALAKPVLDFEARLSVVGKAVLEAGSLETDIALERLDAPGGSFKLVAGFQKESRELALDLKLSEPGGGLIAKALNIEGHPAIELDLNGEGPIDDLDLDLTLDTGTTRILEGQARLRGAGKDLAYDVAINGDLRPLLPEDIKPFFGQTARLKADGLQLGGGGFVLQDMVLETARLRMDGTLRTTQDGFLRQAKFEGILGDGTTATLLPGTGGAVTLRRAGIDLDFGNAQNGRWASDIVLDGLETPSLRVAQTSLGLIGTALNLDLPEARSITFKTKGTATGLDSDDRDIRAALGQDITFGGEGSWSDGAPLVFEDFALLGNGILLELAGELKDWVFDGALKSKIQNLAPFSGLAGRELRGAISLALEGSVSPLISGFDLTLDGDAQSLKFDPALNPLIAGATTLSGRVTRDAEGFRAQNLSLRNPQFEISTDGVVSTPLTDFSFAAAVDDLSLASRKLKGRARVQGSAQGEEGAPIALRLNASIPSGELIKRPLRNARLGLDGTLTGSVLRAELNGAGEVDGQRLALSAELLNAPRRRALSNLSFVAGGARITGDVAQGQNGLLDGSLKVAARDITSLALLALQEGAGSLQADVALKPEDGAQTAEIAANISQLRFGTTLLSNGDLDLLIHNLLGVPEVNGRLDAAQAFVAGIEVEALGVEARGQDGSTTAQVGMTLGGGARLSATADLAPVTNGFAVGLAEFDLSGTEGEPVLTLAEPARLEIAGDVIHLDPLKLRAGDGLLEAEGHYGPTVTLNFDMTDLPLSIANAIDPSLGLSGTLTGQAEANGNPDAPDVVFEFAGNDLSARALQEAGAPSVDFLAQGVTNSDILDFASSLRGGGLEATLSGNVPLRRGDMDLSAELQRFPLTLLERVAGRPGLAGVVSGTAKITGPRSDPRIGFDVTGEGLSARVVRTNRIAPIAAQARGSFERNLVTLDQGRLSNGDGMSLDISGVAPLLNTGLNIDANGRLPLSVANVVLAERGARASGVAILALKATGRVAEPVVAGSIKLAGGTIVDPSTNIRLEDVQFDGVFSGTRLEIRRASAQNSRGGSISSSGAISLNQLEGLPVDISTQVRGFRYTDGRIFSTSVDADLNLSGALTRRSELGGTIELGKTEVTLPKGFGASGAARLDVAHINAPFEVRQTLARAERRLDGVRIETSGSSDIALNITLNAPRQIFLRGRGLDAELGGQVLIGGTTGGPEPVGQFDLIRGRINVLGQRIDLTEGAISLTGTLDPQLGLEARTQTDAVTAVVRVGGNVSDPLITVSSDPELPQDEVLARILFDRPLAELSGLQVARLAAAAAELTGQGGPSFWEQVRRSTGLDDLDFRTEADGATALRAGKYLQDNLYSTIEVNSRGESEVSLNLDISDALKARTSVDLRGNTSVGIFYEKDY